MLGIGRIRTGMFAALAVILATGMAPERASAQSQPWTRLEDLNSWVAAAARQRMIDESGDAVFYPGPLRALGGMVGGVPYDGIWEWTTEEFEYWVCFQGAVRGSEFRRQCAVVYRSGNRLRFDWTDGGQTIFRVEPL